MHSKADWESLLIIFRNHVSSLWTIYVINLLKNFKSSMAENCSSTLAGLLISPKSKEELKNPVTVRSI